MSLRYLSVCSGIEAASVAWRPLGWTPVAFSEIDPFACAVLAHHYPEVPNRGDLRRFQEWPDARVDVLVGGTPCQSFSRAGARGGLDDPRGHLALVFLECVARTQPRWIVWENVVGACTSGDGRDLGAFLGALGDRGYGWAFRILDAQHYGVPQRRRRLFVVAHRGAWAPAAAVCFEPESLRGDSPTRGAEGRQAAGAAADGAGGAVCFRKSRRAQTCDDLETWVRADVANTLNAFDTGERDTHLVVADGQAQRLTPVEWERCFGFPDDYTLVQYRGKPASDGMRYRALGNSMCVPVMSWLGQRIAAVDRLLVKAPLGSSPGDAPEMLTSISGEVRP